MTSYLIGALFGGAFAVALIALVGSADSGLRRFHQIVQAEEAE